MSLYMHKDRRTVEKKCPDPDCPEHGIPQELLVFEEFGRLFLCRDEDIYCAECGTEMTDVWTPADDIPAADPAHNNRTQKGTS